MHWCIQALAFDRKWKHSKFPLKDSDVLPEELMFAKALTLPEPPSKEELLDDDFLDALKADDDGVDVRGSGPETVAAGAAAMDSAAAAADDDAAGDEFGPNSSDDDQGGDEAGPYSSSDDKGGDEGGSKSSSDCSGDSSDDSSDSS